MRQTRMRSNITHAQPFACTWPNSLGATSTVAPTMFTAFSTRSSSSTSSSDMIPTTYSAKTWRQNHAGEHPIWHYSSRQHPALHFHLNVQSDLGKLCLHPWIERLNRTRAVWRQSV